MEQKGEKFCRTLEELVKCPICQERLSGDIAVCEGGHSVCRACTYNRLQRCPIGTCGKSYTAKQNVLAQELLLQLDGIKVCLMELDATKFKLKQDKNMDQSANSKDELLPGQYRCWLTNDCKFIGYASAINEHCKNFHPLEFDEHLSGSLPHLQNWQMNYFTGNNLNRAFDIPKVGLFILHMSRTEHDEMRACIFMYSPSAVAFQYSYRIEIECDEKRLSYNGRVDSARIPKHIVLRSGRKGLFIGRTELLYHALKEKLHFKCSITIEKTNQNDADGTDINSQENPQRKKKGNNYATKKCNCHPLFRRFKLPKKELITHFELLASIDEKEKNNDELFVAEDKKFRCWITEQCRFSADVTAIVEHFKKAHVFHFDEFPMGSLPFTKTWEMNYFIGLNFDHAIKLKGLVFIVHISVNSKGELGTCILMYSSDKVADLHSCQIELECAQQKLLYTKSKVISAKSPYHVISGFRQSGLQTGRNELMYNALKKNELFKCTVMVDRMKENSSTVRKPMHQIRKNMKKLEKSNSNNDISRINIVNDQSVGSKNSTQFSRDKSVPRNQTQKPQCESNNFTFPTKIPTVQSFVDNQPPQLYPNLDAYGAAQGPPVNFVPTPVRHEMIYQRNANFHDPSPMVNNHFNSPNLSSAPNAPYERPPPTNPHFKEQQPQPHQYEQESTQHRKHTGNKSAQKKKADDACVLS